jgi:hypothetical protein
MPTLTILYSLIVYVAVGHSDYAETAPRTLFQLGGPVSRFFFIESLGAGPTPGLSEPGSDYEPGVSAETVSSKVVFLGMVTVPAGARTRAHLHERHETALYLIDGELEIWTGDQLQHQEVVRSGGCILHPSKRAARCSQSRRETSGVHWYTQRTHCLGKRRALSRDGRQGTVGVSHPTPVERPGGSCLLCLQ